METQLATIPPAVQAYFDNKMRLNEIEYTGKCLSGKFESAKITCNNTTPRDFLYKTAWPWTLTAVILFNTFITIMGFIIKFPNYRYSMSAFIGTILVKFIYFAIVALFVSLGESRLLRAVYDYSYNKGIELQELYYGVSSVKVFNELKEFQKNYERRKAEWFQEKERIKKELEPLRQQGMEPESVAHEIFMKTGYDFCGHARSFLPALEKKIIRNDSGKVVAINYSTIRDVMVRHGSKPEYFVNFSFPCDGTGLIDVSSIVQNERYQHILLTEPYTMGKGSLANPLYTGRVNADRGPIYSRSRTDTSDADYDVPNYNRYEEDNNNAFFDALDRNAREERESWAFQEKQNYDSIHDPWQYHARNEDPWKYEY